MTRTNGTIIGQETTERLSPSQALERYPRTRSRLMRRTRAYFAARDRLMRAREEFAEIEELAAQARVVWPIKGVAA